MMNTDSIGASSTRPYMREDARIGMGTKLHLWQSKRCRRLDYLKLIYSYFLQKVDRY